MTTDMRPFLLSFARNLTKNRDIAEDIVQDVMVRAWAKNGEITDSKRYLFQSVMNAYLDLKRKKRILTFTEAWPDDTPQAVWVDSNTPESVAFGVTIDAPLCYEWARLSDDQRLILTMAADDAADIEIAEALGISLGAARCRLARLRKQCRIAVQ